LVWSGILQFSGAVTERRQYKKMNIPIFLIVGVGE